jgi:Asp-tRNA(Asn)/Glu-tRNA(Gln) amidotransferase A subunit family amidase
LLEIIEELTIEQAHEGFRSGAFSVRDLVQAYLDRIEAIDQSGPSLNSIITESHTALEEADALDEAFARDGELVGSLHGVPVLVKDQIETAGLRTTFGSIAAGDFVPKTDATIIARMKQAGAIILGKTTMPDLATSWFSMSSRSGVTGVTKNPYDLSRDPGASSSGSGAAVAANLALVGIGEDTGGSIRVPASWCGLVGLKVTPALISRNGMSSLVETQDSAGPMTRTVTDAALLLDVLAGYDASDPYTAISAIVRQEGSYAAGLADATLRGKRVGVLRQVFPDPADAEESEVSKVMDATLKQLVAAGAELVDVAIPDLDHYVTFTSFYFSQSRQDMNAFYRARPDLPIGSLDKVFAEGQYHKGLELLELIAGGPETIKGDPEYLDRVLEQAEFQRKVLAVFAENQLDAIAFPDTRLAAPTHEDIFANRWTALNYPTNTLIASQLKFPAISVPAGFTESGLPVGLELLSVPYDEARLLKVARGVELATQARRAPTTLGSFVPALEG